MHPALCARHLDFEGQRGRDIKVPKGGLSPLAPTKLTDLASELKDRWQCRVETEVERVRRELVFEPLEAERIESSGR